MRGREGGRAGQVVKRGKKVEMHLLAERNKFTKGNIFESRKRREWKGVKRESGDNRGWEREKREIMH